MYGEYVYITYEGVNFRVFVMCTPSTPQQELQRRARNILETALEKHSIEVVGYKR